MKAMSELTASQRFHAFANPARFMALSDKLLPPLGLLAAVCLAAGVYLSLFVASLSRRRIRSLGSTVPGVSN